MTELSDNARSLFSAPHLAWATTLRPDGTPHSTVVWADVDGDDVIFNTAVGRAKERHLRANPQVAVSVLDPQNAWHYSSVSGSAELTTEDGDAVIDRLAQKYMGVETYPFRQPGEQRVTVRVRATSVIDVAQ